MTPLETKRLVIRNWRDRDRDLFFEINSDETVMAFFPFRRSRAEADAFLDVMRARIDEYGFGFCALELRASGETIGFAGISRTDVVPGLPANTVEIGWRLATPFWGRGYVTEAAGEWLRFGFDELGLGEIVSFAVHDNHRSTAVMERLGMRRMPALDFDHPRIPESQPQLRRHVVYRLRRDDWKAAGLNQRKAERNA